MYPVLACLGQDTLLFKEVEIVHSSHWFSDSTTFIPQLSRKKIEQIQAEDLGQLLQLFAGAQMKSYGGLGGLKTVSFRGLSGQHTAFVINGVISPTDQTGQVNYGNVQTDNLEKVKLNYSTEELLPASALSMASSVSIQTSDYSFSTKKQALRIVQKYGSFGQSDSYLAYKKGDEKERYFVAVSGKYRISGGKYPFEIKNGDSLYRGVRESNHYQDLNFSFGAGVRFLDGSKVRINYQGAIINQELPGPIVLYAPSSNQDLIQQNHFVQANYDFKYLKKSPARLFSYYKHTQLDYTDSNYLNAEGFLNSNFQLHLFGFGHSVRHQINSRITLNVAVEGQIIALESNNYEGNEPLRSHFYLVPSLHFLLTKYLILDVQGSLQSITETKPTQRDWLRVNPCAQLKTKAIWKGRLAFYINYRNSFRMPSFNELYYNKIGNLDLAPERANQVAVGSELSLNTKHTSHLVRVNAYFNQVFDKIVAVPTMNLFQWSIQNIGKVDIVGFDINYLIGWRLVNNQKIDFSCIYNFQIAKDKTEKGSPTFDHQIAYMPIHSGNIDLTYAFKNYSVRCGMLTNDYRYSLNENIEANRVEGFFVFDLSANAFWTIKEKSRISLSFHCKNVLNKSYAVIRNYVMPGRNFLISLSYAFN